MGWIIFEGFISFLEMLISLFFAARLFEKKLERKQDVLTLLGGSLAGAVLLSLRELGILPMPELGLAVLLFSIYAGLVCKVKWWFAVLWAMIDYLLVGIVSITTSSILSMVLEVPMDVFWGQTDGRILVCVLIRLMQLLASEIVLLVMKRFRKKTSSLRNELGMIGMTFFSIVALMLLWNRANVQKENLILLINIFICGLFLTLNFGYLLFKEILSQEKHYNKELTAQNQLISMQIRNQNEVNEMYQSMRALRHDMNNHLHSISGYLQLGEYQNAEEYIHKIIGEVSNVEGVSSENSMLDALIGSKTNHARNNGIRVDVEVTVPRKLQIAAEHLTVVLGNLYDNAIDANLKIEDMAERYIRIKISLNQKELFIYFENAALGENKVNKGFWGTTKKNPFVHGFGIKNIDRIVQLYDGYCERKLEDNVFICGIRLPDKKCDRLR